MTTKTMDALVVEKFGQAALCKMPMPEAPEDGVLIKVHYSGVSIGTEMLQGRGKHSDYTLPFVAGTRRPAKSSPWAQRAEGYSIGEHVAVFCRGSHASYAAAPVGRVHRIANPAKAHLTSLFVQPCVSARNALDQAEVMAEDSVLVLGQGLIGQATAQLARLRGCSRRGDRSLGLSSRHRGPSLRRLGAERRKGSRCGAGGEPLSQGLLGRARDDRGSRPSSMTR
jgi:D-arabinose 1-dehydrogenase-like Zn-dependent alcohol dehydrogenase